MKVCTYASVAQQVCALAGEDFATLDTLDLTHLNRTINRRLDEAWRRDWWPDLLRSEERHWRDTWAASAYADDAEVWHEPTAKYWQANAATVAGDVPGVSSKWDHLATLDPYVARAQAGQTVIGLVRGVFDEDPEFAAAPLRREWRLGRMGIHVLGESAPLSAWVWFMPNVPAFDGAAWASASSYATGDRRHYSSASVGYEGDYWTAAASATAGQSPETHPEKWTRVDFPELFRPFVVAGAYADWLRADGQTDKAIAEQSIADDILARTQLQAFAGTPPVRYRLA